MDDVMSSDQATVKSKQVEALTVQHATWRTELGLHMGFFRSHLRSLQVAFGALIAASGLISSHPGIGPSSGNLSFWFTIVGFFVPIGTTYLFLDTMQPLYNINLRAEMLVSLELRNSARPHLRSYFRSLFAAPDVIAETDDAALAPSSPAAARPEWTCQR